MRPASLRLGKLGSKFFREAMNSEGQAAYSAAVAYCRISSRRAELNGANAKNEGKAPARAARRALPVIHSRYVLATRAQLRIQPS